MSPHLRRVAHQALDMFLDALSEETKTPIKKTRRRPIPPTRPLESFDPKLVEETEAMLKRRGLL